MSAYLVADEENNGTVYLVWSKTPVDKAAVSATPTVKVPDYKFGGGGKSELARGTKDFSKLALGVTSFFKQVAPYKCTAQLSRGTLTTPVLIVFLDTENKVTKFTGKIDLTKQKLVACVKKDSMEYDAKTLNPALFSSKATGGASATL